VLQAHFPDGVTNLWLGPVTKYVSHFSRFCKVDGFYHSSLIDVVDSTGICACVPPPPPLHIIFFGKVMHPHNMNFTILQLFIRICFITQERLRTTNASSCLHERKKITEKCVFFNHYLVQIWKREKKQQHSCQFPVFPSHIFPDKILHTRYD